MHFWIGQDRKKQLVGAIWGKLQKGAQNFSFGHRSPKNATSKITNKLLAFVFMCNTYAWVMIYEIFSFLLQEFCKSMENLQPCKVSWFRQRWS